ncbi:ATP-binding protein [Actinocatenispora comari]|uniref:LuxR family transcriptional regulator n=1 Tax=Actinocatenispora comari TaxID=2807577 RepID=A0A8J4AI14_9ACTN|nr:AAA family ATPase [Actinocatenispora comari]GIL29657.1 LuxR family transcriptional regulator [Actinocatenispora comari]
MSPVSPAGAREPLVERVEELDTLKVCVERLLAGSSGLLVIEGSAGVGKTCLLAALVTLARRSGAQVLTGSGGPSEPDMPLGLRSQLFGQNGRGEEGDAGPERLAEAFDALHGRLVRLADNGPVVIAVDDVHLLDELSLRWLGFLSRRLGELPAILAITGRTDEIAAMSSDAQTDLRYSLNATTIRPAALSRAGVAAMLRSRLGAPIDDELAATVHRMTAGNPRFVTEVCQTLAAEHLEPAKADLAAVRQLAPPGVTRYVLGRLRRNDPTTAAVARAIAVVGGGTCASMIAAMCGMERGSVADVISELAQLGILRAAEPATFVHPIVRNALYASLRSSERQQYHRNAAALLTEQDGDPAQVARHLLAGNPAIDPDMIDTLCRVAVDLIARGEHALGTECLQRAIHGTMSPTHRGRLALKLGSALAVHHPASAISHLRHASMVVRQPDQVNAAHRALSEALAGDGQVLEAIEVLDDCASQLSGVRPELATRARDSATLLSLLHADTAREARSRLPTDRPRGDAARTVLATATAALGAAWAGNDREYWIRALAGVVDSNALTSLQPIECMAVVLPLLYADRLDLADRVLGRLDDEVTGAVAEIAALRSWVALARGHVPAAADQARRAAAAVDDGKGIPLYTDHRSALIVTLTELGEADEVNRIIDLTAPADELPPHWRYTQLLASRGRIRVASGELHAGLTDLRECGRRLTEFGVTNPAVNRWRSTTALALARAGEPGRARQLADEQLRDARRWGTPRAIGLALHVRGLVADETADRARYLSDAVDRLRDSPGMLELARALIDLGAAQIDCGAAASARDLLREALDLAQRCGAVGLTDRSRRELVRSGARPRRRTESGLGSLTSAERRTALLAAQGQTNREIAQQLFVTQRTIELHLTNTYRKLRVAGRAGLIALLAEEADEPTPLPGPYPVPSPREADRSDGPAA